MKIESCIMSCTLTTAAALDRLWTVLDAVGVCANARTRLLSTRLKIFASKNQLGFNVSPFRATRDKSKSYGNERGKEVDHRVNRESRFYASEAGISDGWEILNLARSSSEAFERAPSIRCASHFHICMFSCFSPRRNKKGSSQKKVN